MFRGEGVMLREDSVRRAREEDCERGTTGGGGTLRVLTTVPSEITSTPTEIGRASCRERVCSTV